MENDIKSTKNRKQNNIKIEKLMKNDNILYLDTNIKQVSRHYFING